ncbi:MAG: hypothetical protein GX903_00425 [Spirochaetales bacterium]|nr:hypothetical protein [Spirochaetales bacterium]
MTLSEEDGKLYYRLWLPLLDFVNKKYDIIRRIVCVVTENNLHMQEVKTISDKLYDNIGLIDEYLALHSELSEEHKAIILGFKNFVRGDFLLERHLKKGSVMINTENQKVYLVSGIVSSFEELFFTFPMPLLIKATLLPFKDVIITDGLFAPYAMNIGSNLKKQFKDIYTEAKAEGEIISDLNKGVVR